LFQQCNYQDDESADESCANSTSDLVIHSMVPRAEATISVGICQLEWWSITRSACVLGGQVGQNAHGGFATDAAAVDCEGGRRDAGQVRACFVLRLALAGRPAFGVGSASGTAIGRGCAGAPFCVCQRLQG
jgi:hypothetical protein